MKQGRVWLWHLDEARLCGGFVTLENVDLPRLDADLSQGLRGQWVRVRNAGALPVPDDLGTLHNVDFGPAQPDASGDYLFDHRRGGGRVERFSFRTPKYRWRYEEAARFGEVNTYFHADCIADYLNGILQELGAPALPPVTIVVNAHHAATELEPGIRDGVRRGYRFVPFHGGHYRLPGPVYKVYEHEPVEQTGEVHLGPGWKLLQHGALVEAAGGAYRSNASHNAPIIYHEYGHHLTRHTADFRANALKNPQNQNNLKTAMDEGICDYFTAVMLGVPHIWAWHRRHDEEEIHQRSLVSPLTMADFDLSSQADPHFNGTIWAAALWNLRCRMEAQNEGAGRDADKILLQSLLLLGRVIGEEKPLSIKSIRRARDGFDIGLRALLCADEMLFGARNSALICEVFTSRGIEPSEALNLAAEGDLEAMIHGEEELSDAACACESPADSLEDALERLRRHNAPEEIPADEDIMSGDELKAFLKAQKAPPLSLIATGDSMLGGRTRPILAEHGKDYIFAGTRPLLRRAPIVLGNLEGPFAREAPKESRNYSYRVNPKLAAVLKRAGFNVLTLANNHLLDCGRKGVFETLTALEAAEIAPLGAGINDKAAHEPVILQAGDLSVGLLGYYWNRRTSARPKLPGSAMDSPEEIQADISALRPRVDRVVATFHWGVPYEREPSSEDRAKARFAIDCGADAVIGHHPHIVQPFEIYNGCPIFYSVGNFAFGSGNSKGESLLVGMGFEDDCTRIEAYPVYVKNRDPRLNYQPKVLRGAAGAHVLNRLVEISGEHGRALNLESCRATLSLPYTRRQSEVASC